MLQSALWRAVALITTLSFTRAVAAQSCEGSISRENVVPCAITTSLALASVRAQSVALEGQRMAVSPLLPANPQLTLSAAHRSNSNERSGNWYATLSQELEIAGQRSARLARADAALRAQQSTLVASERDVAALAWRAYFEALAARDLLSTAVRLEQVFVQSTQVAQAGAAQGLVSGLDANVSDLNTLRLSRERIEAERSARSSVALLSTLLARDPGGAQSGLQGELTPLQNAAALGLHELDGRVDQRAEVVRARQAQELQRAQRSVLERSRVPNVTLSLQAQRDGFGEQVWGGGIALPIPLPYPLGRTLRGELSENAALIRQADSELDQIKRSVRLELVTAFYAEAAAKAQAELYTSERVERAQRSLEDLAQALRAGRIPISEVVVAQQTLVEFLRANIQAKLELCLASVDLARSAGLSLWGAGL